MLNNTHQNEGRGSDELQIEVQNIGGISQGQVTLSPGVTLLAGENASNKTSFLRALSAVLGGPSPPLKSDASTGSVRLEVGGDEYYLELSDQDESQVVTDAKQISDLEDLCELFVALNETNPVRQAVVNDGDLYGLLMRPIDTEEIEAEIERLEDRKDSIDDQLAELNQMEDQLPTLRTRSNNLRQDLDDIKATLSEKRDAIEEREAETSDEDEDVAGNDAALDELRSERDAVRKRIHTQEAALESLREEYASIREQLDALASDKSPTDVEQITGEIEQLHHQKQQLTTTINSLSPIVEMNRQLLDDRDEVPAEMKSDDIVAELDPTSQNITCWTCGNSVEQSEIAEQVRVVEEIVQEKRQQRETITERIQSLEDKKQQVERRREERERLLERQQDTDDEIDRREEQLSDLRDRQTSLETDIEALQAEVRDDDQRNDELLELHDEVSDLEYERGTLENELRTVEQEVARIEAALSERADLEKERAEVASQLQEQREQIETLERDLVSTFNETMQQILDMLAYDRIERVWIERLSTGSGSTETEFEIHIVRSNDEGAAYEDTIDSLSKSEREVISLVVALTGYLAHDVADKLSIIIVDAVEMLDANRIEGLLEYFSQHAAYVVTAVLPEEAAELDDTYPTISTSDLAMT